MGERCVQHPTIAHPADEDYPRGLASIVPMKGAERIEVQYDETAPCKACGEPVTEASMGGTDLCPWCDMGKCRWCGRQLLDPRHHVRHCPQRPVDAAEAGNAKV